MTLSQRHQSGLAEGNGERNETRLESITLKDPEQQWGRLPLPTTSLTQIYSHPQEMPMTSKGIVVHALNVVSDPAVCGNSSNASEVNLKKISKRRRKANGEVDVEHTKSCNEFLRKVQQSLAESQGGSSEEERPEESDRDSDADHRTETRYQSLFRNQVQYTTASKHWNLEEEDGSTTSRTVQSSLYSPRSSLQTVASVGSADKGEDYGYEDPDKVIPPNQVHKEPRVARRRGSVTEHTIRAAQQAAAVAAAERARMILAKTRIDTVSENLSTDSNQSVQRYRGILQRQSRPAFLNRGTCDRALELTRRTPSSLSPSSDRHGSQHYARGVREHEHAFAVNRPGHEEMAINSGDASNNPDITDQYGYGYEDLDSPGTSNPYGYEDPETSSNPYGYGGTSPQASQEQRKPRAQRRGSVTKYSLDAAQNVQAAMRSSANDRSSNPVPPKRTNSSTALRQGPQSGPGRQTHTPSFAARRARLALNAMAVASPPLAQASRSFLDASTRSGRSTGSADFSYRSGRSRDMPSDSDDEDNITIASGESSLDGDASVTSMTIPLKDCDRLHDVPMFPPSRHDSVRSSGSRDSGAYSIRTFDSDGDSLAPDMKSMCSISNQEHAGYGSLPAPPMYLPRTPTRTRSSRRAVGQRSLTDHSRGQISPYATTRSFHEGKASEDSPIPFEAIVQHPSPSSKHN